MFMLFSFIFTVKKKKKSDLMLKMSQRTLVDFTTMW